MREMLSYDGVLRCVGLTLAALPLNMEVNPTDAAPVGDTPLGDIDGGDLGNLGDLRPASWDLCLTCPGLWSALSSSISPKELRSEKLASEPLLLRT